MAFDVSGQALLNTVGAVAFVLVGAFALAIGRGHGRAVSLAAIAIGVGAPLAVFNIWGPESATLEEAIRLPFRVAAFAGSIALVLSLRPLLRMWELAVSVGSGVAYGALLFLPGATDDPTWSTASDAIHSASSVMMIPAAAFAYARAGPGAPYGRPALAYLTLGFGIYYMWRFTPAGPTSPFVQGTIQFVPVLLGVLAWLVPTRREGSRLARNVLLTLLVAALVQWGSVAVVVPMFGLDPATDFGLPGISRTIGSLLLVLAILRHDLLGVELPRWSVRRGPIAAGALALLFIVAQIGQNFLSARYGLLMGGIVAGTFLFAASPIQRAMERTFQPDRAPVPPPDRATTQERLAQSEGAYRVMLRRALADGGISAEEELALAHLADEAGLTTRRVTEIRHDIEREMGRRH